MPNKDVVKENRGQLMVVTEDHNRNFVMKGHGSVTYIEEITRTLETGIIYLVLKFEYGGEWQTVTIPRSHLQDRELLKYADYGLNVSRGNIKHVVEFIRSQEKKHTPRLVHEGIGFDTIMNKDTGKVEPIFKCHESLPMGTGSTYAGTYDIKPKGNKLVGFRKFLQENVYGTPLELAVVIGLVGVLIGFITKEVQCPNIVTSIYGKSSSGKSSFAMLSISMGSNPDEHAENPLFRDFYGTDNSLMGSLDGNFGYPICFDEANRYQGKDLSAFVYNMEAGTSKQRMTREAKMQKRKIYHTSVITTAEMSIINRNSQNAGEAVRSLEFGNISWTRDAAHSERIKEYALNNYGRPIIHLANKVITLGKAEVIRRFKENRKTYLAKGKVNDEFTHRMSIKYALLLTTLQLANECMELDLSYDLVMDMLVDNEYETSGKRDLKMKTYDYLVQTFNVNIDKFSIALNRNLIFSARGQAWGIQDPQRRIFVDNCGKYRTIVYFSEQTFERILREGNFEDTSVILKQLNESGYLHCQKDGKRYHLRKTSANGSQAKVYGIKLYDDSDMDSDEALAEQLHELDLLKKKHGMKSRDDEDGMPKSRGSNPMLP